MSSRTKHSRARRLYDTALNLALLGMAAYLVYQYAGLLYPSTRVDDPQQARVVMYATRWCPYCIQARSFFARNKIPYYEIDIDRSPEGYRLFRALGGRGVPLIVVGEQTIMHGLQKKRLKQALLD